MLLDVWMLWQKTHIKSSCIWQTAVNTQDCKRKRYDMIWPVLKQVFSCFCPPLTTFRVFFIYLHTFRGGRKIIKAKKSGSLWHLAVNGWSCLTSRPSLKCKKIFLKALWWKKLGRSINAAFQECNAILKKQTFFLKFKLEKVQEGVKLPVRAFVIVKMLNNSKSLEFFQNICEIVMYRVTKIRFKFWIFIRFGYVIINRYSWAKIAHFLSQKFCTPQKQKFLLKTGMYY